MKSFYKYLFIGILISQSLSTRSQTDRSHAQRISNTRWADSRILSGNSSYFAFEIQGGTLWGWGYNVAGQLGDGSTTTRKFPVQIGSDNTWVSVATGVYHTLGLKSDGTLWAWGGNTYGQLGNGTNTAEISPIQIGTDHDWTSITTSYYHSLATKANGTLWAWGDNASYALGDGTNTQRTSPVQIGNDSDWVSVKTGYYHTLALKSNGSLWAWGGNSRGQLGDGTNNYRTSAVQVGTGNTWVTIVAGLEHSMAIQADGTLWSWGNNYAGQLGTGNNNNEKSPKKVGTDNKWAAIAGAGAHSLGLKVDGTLWAWGSNLNGQIGDSTNTERDNPVQVGFDNKWVGISAAYYTSYGTKSDGSIWSWGANNTGSLGDSTTTTRIVPVKISSIPDLWVRVASGQNHNLGTKSNGTLWACGANDQGQLGDLSTATKLGLVQIGNDQKWLRTEGGKAHSLAIKTDGTLWAWGANADGQLGDATTTSQNSPKKIGQDIKWVRISAGGSHSLAIKTDGTLWAWGNNNDGQLGDGSNSSKSNPTQIGSDEDWVSIAAGGSHSIALKANGTLWAWGANTFGQLGDGGNTSINTPTQIGSSTAWTNISVGFMHSAALQANGSAWVWGYNGHGALGTSSYSNESSPIQVAGNHQWVHIACGDSQTTALKSDGTLWTAGNNANGQLADSSTTSKNYWVQMGSENNWASVSIGGSHSIGLKNSKEQFCGAGLNSMGQLGNGSGANSNTYTCNNCIAPAAPAHTTNNASLTICGGNTTTLTALGVGTLSWYDQPLGGIYMGSGTSFTSPILNTTTDFYIQDSTCTSSVKRTKVTVTVNPKPAALVGSNQTICVGQSLSLGGMAVSGNTYAWTSNLGGYTSTMATITVSPTSTTTYYLTETNAVGCNYSDSAIITVIAKPLAKVGANKSICLGDSTEIGDLVNNGSNYTWTSNPAGFNSTQAKLYVTPSQNTIYYLTESISGCSNSDSVSVTVNPLPNATVAAAQTICMGSTITLGAAPVVGNTYIWSSSPVGFSANQSNPAATPSASTIYYLQETIINSGCTKSNSVSITVNPLPEVSTSLVNTTITATQAGGTYQWIDCGNNNISINGETNKSYAATKNGKYAVIVSINGCTDTSDCVSIGSIGIENIHAKQQTLYIYPNPNSGTFIISGNAEGIYQISNELGQHIYTFKLSASNSFKEEIVNLPSGIYFISGANQTKMYHQKVIVIN